MENTFWAIQNSFIYLEMHSKRRYKICICSVILGERESFRNYKRLSIIFSENFRWNLTYYEIETFSDSSRHHIFESENFRIPFFPTKNSLT